MSERRAPSTEITSKQSEAKRLHGGKSDERERNHDGGGRCHHPICISFCTCIYTRPNEYKTWN